MKIISWNCNGAFRKKYHALQELTADILIIQECENPALSSSDYQEWAENHLWVGKNKNKGIGIFAKPNIQISQLNWPDFSLELFLPCRVNNEFNLIGTWTRQASSPNFEYIGQLWKYIQVHRPKFVNEINLICGDLNSNSRWDVWDRWWNHCDVIRELQSYHMHSLYHKHHNEEQGKETSPTFYMHRKLHKPYHIDYAIAHDNLIMPDSNVTIGKPEEWLIYSDHMPLIFEIKG